MSISNQRLFHKENYYVFETIVALLQFGMMLICARGLQNPKPTRPVLKTLGVQRDFRCEAFTLFA
jgi:hypothetical protein